MLLHLVVIASLKYSQKSFKSETAVIDLDERSVREEPDVFVLKRNPLSKTDDDLIDSLRSLIDVS